jgi:hypothetical protein
VSGRITLREMCRRTKVNHCTALTHYPLLCVVPQMFEKVDYHINGLLPHRKTRKPRIDAGGPISDRVRGQEQLEPFTSTYRVSAGKI